ncbi:hypothetical protein THAOC_20927, partial [Thalassiosira oceanica]
EADGTVDDEFAGLPAGWQWCSVKCDDAVGHRCRCVALAPLLPILQARCRQRAVGKEYTHFAMTMPRRRLMTGGPLPPTDKYLNVDWHTGDAVDVTMTPAAECCDDEGGNRSLMSSSLFNASPLRVPARPDGFGSRLRLEQRTETGETGSGPDYTPLQIFVSDSQSLPQCPHCALSLAPTNLEYHYIVPKSKRKAIKYGLNNRTPRRTKRSSHDRIAPPPQEVLAMTRNGAGAQQGNTDEGTQSQQRQTQQESPRDETRPTPATPAGQSSARGTATMTEMAPPPQVLATGRNTAEETKEEGNQDEETQAGPQAQQRSSLSRLSSEFPVGTTCTIPTVRRRRGYRLSTEKHPDNPHLFHTDGGVSVGVLFEVCLAIRLDSPDHDEADGMVDMSSLFAGVPAGWQWCSVKCNDVVGHRLGAVALTWRLEWPPYESHIFEPGKVRVMHPARITKDDRGTAVSCTTSSQSVYADFLSQGGTGQSKHVRDNRFLDGLTLKRAVLRRCKAGAWKPENTAEALKCWKNLERIIEATLLLHMPELDKITMAQFASEQDKQGVGGGLL